MKESEGRQSQHIFRARSFMEIDSQATEQKQKFKEADE